WRISVSVVRTADEFGIVFRDLIIARGLKFEDIDSVIMSSVQPPLNYTIAHACEYYLGQVPLMVGPGIKTGLNIKYLNPQEVGADRIVNSVAAYKLYGGPCIVVDFGTATTFNAISEKGEFVGGCIAPGIKTSLDSLVNNTARLPRVELARPSSVIGKTTASNMQAGIVYGFTGLVKYIVENFRKTEGFANAKVLATGGLSELIINDDPDEQIIDIIDRSLTLTGLKIIYDMNANTQE
ncbi:MAG: type III pantothenate kinase, partial [Clostridia bacterium]